MENRTSGDVSIDSMNLRKIILKKDKEGAIDYIEDLFINNLRETVDVDVLYQLSLKIALVLQDIKVEYKLAKVKKMQDLTDMLEKIYQAEDIYGLKKIFIGEITDIITYLHTENSHYTPVARQLMEEVAKNYKEDMNLKIHTLEDLEPWLELIKEKEPDVVPMYLTKDYSAPTYMDKIQDPVGIEYGDDSLTVQNVFETEKMQSTLATMRKYFEAGYINKDAATASDDKSIKRFVTKGDGQPYAELIWSKDLGYDVVATQIMDTQVTNASARGALTAVNKNTEYPEKCVEFLNLLNTDTYLRNLLNYGIEGVHWDKAEVPEEEAKAAEGKEYVLDYKVKLNPEKQKDYAVAYFVQGGMFNTAVLETEPIDKWATFKEFNEASQEAPSFGFDFDLDPVSTEVAGFRNVLDEFGRSLYTGSVDPEEYLPKMKEKMEATGIQKVIDEMQNQIKSWKSGETGSETE